MIFWGISADSLLVLLWKLFDIDGSAVFKNHFGFPDFGKMVLKKYLRSYKWSWE